VPEWDDKGGESLFPSDQAVLDDEALEKALSTNLVMPAHARVAILRFGDRLQRHWWSEETWRLNQNVLADLVAVLEASDRVSRARLMPSLLTPERRTIPVLREAAARCQADLLVVYRSAHRMYIRDRFLAADRAKASCTVEALLLDVRSGLVPWTTTVVKTYETKKARNDFTFGETMHKAKLAALDEALDEVAGNLVSFLSAADEPGTTAAVPAGVRYDTTVDNRP
jgi:hypothetical protein